jgi:DNA-binding SARP family transcriptional activator
MNGRGVTAPKSLRRPRLLHALADPTTQIGIIVAPAGSGKSTLLNQMLSAHPGPKIHYCLSAYDLGPAGLTPTLTSFSDQLLSAGSDGEELPLLLLDDIHLLSGTTHARELEAFLDTSTGALRVVMAGRLNPALNLSRHRVAGHVVDVNADDLRFRSWEVSDLFRTVYGVHLAPSEQAHLAQAVDGWAAGLQLFRLATQRKSDSERRAAIDRLTRNRASTVREYLTRNILDGLDPDLLWFLVNTSVLGTLSKDMCVEALALTLRSGTSSRASAEEDLDRLVERCLSDVTEAQLFVSTVDTDAIRVHEIMRSHLETMLADSLSSAELHQRYATAADVLCRHGFVGDAVRALLCANELGDALELLKTHGSKIAGSSQSREWTKLLPRALSAEDAHLTLLTAQRAAQAGNFREAIATYELLRSRDLPSSVADQVHREHALLLQWTAASDSGLNRHGLRIMGSPTWLSMARIAVTGEESPSVDGARAADMYAADALQALLVGDASRCLTALDLLADIGPRRDGAFRTAAVTACGALARWIADGDDPSDVLAALRDEADRNGDGLLGRVMAAMLLAFPLEDDPPEEEIATPLLRECAAGGDPWTAAIAHLFLGLGVAFGTSSKMSRSAARDHLGQALLAFRSLDAELLANWAGAGLASLVDHYDAAIDALISTAVIGDTLSTHVIEAARAHGPISGPAPFRALALCAISQPSPQAKRPDTDDLLAPRARFTAEETLTIEAFGGLRVASNGTTHTFDQLKPRAQTVLRIIATRTGGVSCDEIIDRLWPDVDPTTATKSLQVSVSQIRGALGEAGKALVRRNDRYVIITTAPSDVDRFEQHALQANLAEARGDHQAMMVAAEFALAEYRDVFLPECSAEWAIERRAELASLHARACEQVANHALRADDFGRSVRVAELGLKSDTYADSLWQILISALASCGATAECARAKRRYQSVLTELGIEPSRLESIVGSGVRGV